MKHHYFYFLAVADPSILAYSLKTQPYQKYILKRFLPNRDLFHFNEDGVIPTLKKFSLILDFLTKCMKTRQRSLSKLSQKTGQLVIEFAHHICYIQKSRRNIEDMLISVSLQITKIET